MGATMSRTAPGTNTLEPSEPTGRWRGGGGAPGVRSRLQPPRLWFLHASTPPPPSDPSVCGAAALHLFPLLSPLFCFLFSTILTINGALPTGEGPTSLSWTPWSIPASGSCCLAFGLTQV